MKQNEGGIVAKNARSRDAIDRPELLGEFGSAATVEDEAHDGGTVKLRIELSFAV